MSTDVRRNEDQARYEIRVDGDLAGIADYHAEGDTVVFPHTEIAGELRGRGLGAELVRHALDDTRRRGLKVVPACSYVARFIDENPGYADLVAS